MPKVKITTDRQPWIDDKPQPEGAELDVSADVAATLVDLGFAVVVEAKKAASK
jgi:hypothetical protein